MDSEIPLYLSVHEKEITKESFENLRKPKNYLPQISFFIKGN